MSSHVVPRALIAPGPAPSAGKDGCSVCRRPRAEHSGDTCRVCSRPVEHHTDPAELELEVIGRARVSEARLAAGLTITDSDRWCIDRARRLLARADTQEVTG